MRIYWTYFWYLVKSHQKLTSSPTNNTTFHFGENDHLCWNRDGNNHQLYQNRNPVIGDFNCYNVTTNGNSQNYLVTDENDHLLRNRDCNNHQLFQSKNSATGKFNRCNITTDDIDKIIWWQVKIITFVETEMAIIINFSKAEIL